GLAETGRRAPRMPRRAMTPSELVERFATNVPAQTDCIWRGDAKTGNRHAKRYGDAFQRLREIGDEGRDALAVLLEHERPDVRVKAAVYLLRYRTDAALKVLWAVAAGEGMIPFFAQQAIKRWEEGTWELDPE